MRIQGRRRILNRLAAEETFIENEHWLKPWMANTIARGVEEGVVVSAVHDAFMYAYDRFDRSRKCSFSSFFTTKLRSIMIDQQRLPKREYNVLEEIGEQEARPRRSWEEMKNELPPDAQVVAALAIDPPSFIQPSGGCLASLRVAIRNLLMNEMGWEPKRIKQAFADLALALQ